MISELLVSPQGGAGAVCTLPQALDAWRRLRECGEAEKSFTIRLKGGVHPLTGTVRLTAADTGLLTICGDDEVPAVLDGGVRLTGWRELECNGNRVYAAKVPETALAAGAVRQFFVNGERRTRARFPKNGDLTPADRREHITGVLFTASDCLFPRPGDWSEQWTDPSGVEGVLIQKWTDCRLPVDHYDAQTGEVVFARHTRFEINPDYTRYWWENVREALTEPGEYWFDRVAGEIVYYPMPNEDMATAEAVVPALNAFFLLAGEPGKTLRFPTIRNLEFRYGGASYPNVDTIYDLRMPQEFPNGFISGTWLEHSRFSPRYGGSPQSAAHLPGLISCFFAGEVTIRDCRFRHSGWYGVLAGPGCDLVRVEHCDFQDLGGGGITASGGRLQMPAEAVTRRLLITDNRIGDCGQINRCACGILLGHVSGCVVEHNHIHDLYYSGISCGWVWGFAPNAAHDNRIGFNNIHDLGKRMLCDMGGIYLLGVQPGTRLYNNHIRDVAGRFYGGWGIYTDEGSSHVVIEENICYDCRNDGFHQHYGRENILRGNISAFNGESGLRISAGRDTSATRYELPGEHYRVNLNFIGNVVVQTQAPFFLTQAPETMGVEEFYSEGNYFYDPNPGRGEPFARNVTPWDGITYPDWHLGWKAWRESGHDRFSRWEDPGFVDLENRDFHLKPDSPLRGAFPDPARTLDLCGPRKAARE